MAVSTVFSDCAATCQGRRLRARCPMHSLLGNRCIYCIITVMNLRHLRTFMAVADAGGFGRALGRLHLSQPAASRQIDALEAELGVLLFERSGRGIRLTSSGEDLLRRSRMVVDQA